MAVFRLTDSAIALAWLVWLIPIIGSIIVPLLAKSSNKTKGLFSVFIGLVSTFISLSMLAQLETTHGLRALYSSIAWIPSLGINLGVTLDPLSCLFTILISSVGTFVLIYSLGYMAGEDGLTRYYSLMLLFIGSMIGLIMADNLLQLFVFWEMVGFCSYALVGFWYKRQKAVKAATQVLLMTKIGDVSLLIAIFLLYVNTGTLNILELTRRVAALSPSILLLSSLLLLFGAIAKSAQLPMHTWLFSAMEAPTSVSCLLHGATMVKAGIYLLARTFSLFSSVGIWLSLMMWIGLGTAFLAATLALSTTDIKGVAAYSTISQIGYMMAGLGASTTYYSLGWFASIYHLVNHAFFQGIGFLSAGIIVHQIGSRDLKKMGGLMHDLPMTFAVALVTFLSRSAIPPFGGFFSKEMLAEALLNTKNLPSIILFYLTSALTVAYSLRLILLVYVREKPRSQNHLHLHKEQLTMILPALFFALICGILGLLADPMSLFLGVHLPLEHFQLSGTSSSLYMLSLMIGLIPVYLFYTWRFPRAIIFNIPFTQPLLRLLRNGFYLDAFYGTMVIQPILLFSDILNKGPESFLCNRLPYLVADGVVIVANVFRTDIDTRLDRLCYVVAGGAMSGARGVREHADKELDRLSYVIAGKTVEQARGIAKSHTGMLPHFVLAAVLGISMLSVLLFLVYYFGGG